MTPDWTIYTAIAGILLILLLPQRCSTYSRMVALVSALLGFVIAAQACWLRLIHPDAPVWKLSHEWIPQIGAKYSLEANGLSCVLLLLTGVMAISGVLFSWNVERRSRAFFAWYLAIIAGVYGVFLCRDAFLLFVCYELVILPKYMLISIWGSTNREYGAMKLTMYSIAASAFILVGIGVAYAVSGGVSFDLNYLVNYNYPVALQAWAFPILFLGFAILAGMFPFHTWAPTGHVAAPTAASMLLAGVVMKLGAYGAMCVAMPIFAKGFEMWRPVIVVLAVGGILYGALTALRQKDLKFVIGYSSVSHMGFVILGLAAANLYGLRGAAMQMVSHGVIAGLLFGIAGRVVYERTHTRDLEKLGEFNLWKSLPGAAVAFTLAMAASMGIPGFSGFVAELFVVIGLWQVYPWMVIAVGFGIIVTGAFSLRAIQRGFFMHSANSTGKAVKLPPLTKAEVSAIVLLLIVSLAIGVYPKPWMDLIDQGLKSPLFHTIL